MLVRTFVRGTQHWHETFRDMSELGLTPRNKPRNNVIVWKAFAGKLSYGTVYHVSVLVQHVVMICCIANARSSAVLSPNPHDYKVCVRGDGVLSKVDWLCLVEPSSSFAKRQLFGLLNLYGRIFFLPFSVVFAPYDLQSLNLLLLRLRRSRQSSGIRAKQHACVRMWVKYKLCMTWSYSTRRYSWRARVVYLYKHS